MEPFHYSTMSLAKQLNPAFTGHTKSSKCVLMGETVLSKILKVITLILLI
jgi:hypothetical protein